MPCRSPLPAYRNKAGDIIFNPKEPEALTGMVTLNCGQCRDCRLRRTREWAIRCTHEAQMHDRSSFVTLTFAEDPGTVCKKDLQLWLKRLRKKMGKLRYYACGEYGEKFGRPHYHAILFGVDFSHDRVLVKKGKFGPAWTSKTLLETWQTKGP